MRQVELFTLSYRSHRTLVPGASLDGIGLTTHLCHPLSLVAWSLRVELTKARASLK